MKAVEEVVVCVVDYGTFLSVAEKLAETMAHAYYHSPFETEYQDVRNCIKGQGLSRVERLDDYLDPEILDSIDLFVFPDIGFGGVQRHLRSLGKAVWGHMGADELELSRDLFLDTLQEAGLPAVHSERITGLDALVTYLAENDNKWIKINRFRGNMETWHHVNLRQSMATLNSLAVIFGPTADFVKFVVQDDIESELEIGYDGWCIDGTFPSLSFQGYEKKNELYLGSVLKQDDLPEEITVVNNAFAEVLKRYGYRDWWATEIRVADGVPYFIDPTPRLPGQTGEHQLESCRNFANVIWMGANGIVEEPDFEWQFAAEATLHFQQDTKDDAIDAEWKTLAIEDTVGAEAARWYKLYHYCQLNGANHFGSGNGDEVGVALGFGDTVEAAIDHLQENLDAIKDLPVKAKTSGFASLLDSIKEAEDAGLKFGGKIPKPEKIMGKLRG